MCGIAGLLSLDGAAPVDRGALEAMSAALIHRGPDSHGTVVEGAVGLAARRLSIIDLDTGDQPIRNEDGTVVVVQNGEIYNYEALRAELRGHTFSTHGDTEVLAHLYEEHGPRFVERLRGMFAIALWDAKRARLVLARDPFGIKPLYYCAEGGTLAFASELKALQKRPHATTDVDLDAVTAFLAFNSIPAPLSIYAAVRKLPPGHLLIAQEGRIEIECFARPKPTARLRTESARELAAEARDRLRDSVRAHLVADVPVGVLLSGGIDSSLLTALAAQEAGERVSTFSIGFKERSFDELDLARQVAGLYGTDHHELVVEPDAAELLPKIVAAFDEPFADSSALPTYLVSQLAAEHVKVVLSGEGGDELFGGYETYAADLLAPRLKPFLPVLDPLARALPSGSGRVPLDYKLKRFTAAAHLPPLERHHGFKEIFSADAREQLLEAGRRSAVDPLEYWREAWEETAGVPELARLQHVDRAVYLVDDLLVKTDRMSMAHSLEARVPFLDPTVAELAHALPTSMKVRGTQKKRLLRMAAEPLLPKSIVRGRKRGFSIPAAAWLRGPLEPFAREVLSPATVARQGFFAPAAVTRVLDEHVSGRVDYSRQLWGLMSFTLWRSGG
jgi:asparagine synthase (glutamine-hydrolysing)